MQNEEEIVEIGPDHYGDAKLDRTLASYAHEPADVSVLMPIAGIRCVQALMRISDGRLLLLSLDKGITGHGRMDGWFEQPFVTHGGVFSYLVNYDAFRRYFEENNGSSHYSSSDERSLVCFIGTIPALATPGGHLQRFFEGPIDSIDVFNAFVSFSKGLYALPVLTDATGVAPLFDLLARMRGDADAFSAVMYRSVDVLIDVATNVHSLARRMAELAKENFFSPRIHNDVFYWSGRLYHELGEMEMAERDFAVSVASFAEKSHAHFFLGAIAEVRGDIDSALLEYEQHRMVQPDSTATRSAIRRVHAKLAKRRESVVGG